MESCNEGEVYDAQMGYCNRPELVSGECGEVCTVDLVYLAGTFKCCYFDSVCTFRVEYIRYSARQTLNSSAKTMEKSSAVTMKEVVNLTMTVDWTFAPT